MARILTDNGSCYRAKRFRRACERLGIKHSFTRPYRPQTNGKAERFIKTAMNEWAYVPTYQHWRERAKDLPPTAGIVLMPPSATAHSSADLAG